MLTTRTLVITHRALTDAGFALNADAGGGVLDDERDEPEPGGGHESQRHRSRHEQRGLRERHDHEQLHPQRFRQADMWLQQRYSRPTAAASCGSHRSGALRARSPPALGPTPRIPCARTAAAPPESWH
jgi:hypothetical protein